MTMDKKNSKGAPPDPKHEHAAIEKLATKLVADWTVACGKLKSLAPEIDQVEKYFANHVRGSVTVLACRSFKEFCTKKLKRDRSTVYEMLLDWRKPESNEREGEVVEETTPVQPSKREQLKQELAEAKADANRLRPVGQAAGKYANAVTKGDEALKEEAIKELLHTVNATPPTGLNANDEPNLALMLEELLTKLVQVSYVSALPEPFVVFANAQIKRLSLHGKIGFVQSVAKSAAHKGEAAESAITGLLAAQAAKEMPQIVPAAGSAS